MKKHFSLLFLVLVLAVILSGAATAANITVNNSTGIQNATNNENATNLSDETSNEIDILDEDNLTSDECTLSGFNPFTVDIEDNHVERGSKIPAGEIENHQFLSSGFRWIGNNFSFILTEAKYRLSSFAGSIADLLRNPVTAKISHFREDISPNITTTDPANGVTISTNQAITITFDKPIKVWNKNIQLKTSSGTDVPVTNAIVGNKLIITPVNPLEPNTPYSLIIYKAAVTDLEGNPNNRKSINFITGTT